MKLRIVEKLADMARAIPGNTLTPKEIDDIAYLNDFAQVLKVPTAKVAETASFALDSLLNNYSDFKVSTIDSFFQNVLRTFAYESNLNDAYQVEIDNDYVASAAIDATLNDMNTARTQSATAFWLGELMNNHSAEGKTTWNVFQKGENDNSIYTRMRNAVLNLEKEDFKEVRQSIDEYFDTDSEMATADDPLVKSYLGIKQKILIPLENALGEAKIKAAELQQLFRENHLNVSGDGHRFLAGHLRKIKKTKADTASDSLIFKPLDLSRKDSILAKGVSSPAEQILMETASQMYDAYSRWLKLRESSEWIHWRIYATNIPYLGILGHARRNMKKFLDFNNTIQLGETNSMLRRIIGDDDAPFIYERLGSVINHFLIDEFQDTSRLQWENLRPLLSESNSRGEDNLIIGDAKQSIYRFRNADPSLITTHVPASFPDRIDAGSSIADNTNWRSARTIVEFNNFFFHSLIKEILEDSYDTIDFPDLYSNVAQFASHRKREGYVEINFIDSPAGDTAALKKKGIKQAPSSDERATEIALERLPHLITSLIKRGYRQQDIAVLTRTNRLGKQVIDRFVAYNSTLTPDDIPIEFISEESLLISSSEAVGIIISVLENMMEGSDFPRPDNKKDSVSWADIKCNFSFYALQHPEMTVAEQVRTFLNGGSPAEALSTMIAGMQTVALPALVEAITESFVPENLRKSQAAFIAALQDLVLDFAERHAADVPSFLKWWHSKGINLSISSPEGTDAVQVMTIHKSKGLEFKCVILPYTNDSLLPGPNKTEWKWVRPATSLQDYGLPPFLPIDTKSDLLFSEHSGVWTRYSDLFLMDMLNSFYVAFTRAVSELYIFTGYPVKKSNKIGRYLFNICNEAERRLWDIPEPDPREFMLPEGIVRWNDDHDVVTIGEPVEPDSKEDSKDTSSENNGRIISEYGVDSSPAILKYVEGDDDTASPLSPEEADADPRSEGNLLHAVMEKVAVKEDLHRALTSLLMKGLINREQMKEWKELLQAAMEEEPASSWFSSEWKVINERSIIFPVSPTVRPDRVIVSPDSKRAVIIDYKFGTIPKGRVHIDQVAKYISAFAEATGITSIEGYIWYVRQHEIVAVNTKK